jgi:O-antigen ligase
MPLLLACGAALLAALAGWGNIVGEFLRRNQDAEQFTTLSGRLYYWTVAWNFFKESIWFGHGYYTSTRLDLTALYRFGSHDLSTVDNTYLEILLGVGIAGAIPLVVALLLLARHLLRRTPFSQRAIPTWNLKVEMIGVLIILLFRGTTGSTFQVHSENLIILVFIMAFFQCLARENSRGLRPLTMEHYAALR